MTVRVGVSEPAAKVSRATSWAVGAHSAKLGVPPFQVTPSARDRAFSAYTSSSTPGVCTPVASTSLPRSSYDATASCPCRMS